MGQYYNAICVDTSEWVYSHDYQCGSKLMEHSYIDNAFVNAVMTLLSPGGAWHKKRIVWAGDRISVETKRPEGYEEIEIDFREG